MARNVCGQFIHSGGLKMPSKSMVDGEVVIDRTCDCGDCKKSAANKKMIKKSKTEVPKSEPVETETK